MNTPQAIPGTVEMVSVEWAMKNLIDSIDGFGRSGEVDFAVMLNDKASDGHFGDLIATILDHGFRVPVCFYPARRWSTDMSKIEDGWALGNGHHRMSAAILLCLDSIPVYFAREGEGYMVTSTTDTEELMWDSGDYTLGEWLSEELSDLTTASRCWDCEHVHDPDEPCE